MTTTGYRLVACLMARNEEWILERWLQRTSEFADGIVFLDDGSTDRTADIIRGHPKVHYLYQEHQGPGQGYGPRNRMLDAARSLGAEWVMMIDADEIMDVRLADHLDEILAQPSLGRVFFREVTLWRSNEFYRIDKPEMYGRDKAVNQILRLTPALRWVLPPVHRVPRRALASLRSGRIARAPVAGHEALVGIAGHTLQRPDLVRVHYHFADWERAWRTHLRYAVRDAIQFRRALKDIPQIVEWATARLDETGLELAPVKPEWGVL